MTNLIISVILIAAIVWFFVTNTRRKKTAVLPVPKRDLSQLLANNIIYYNKLEVGEKARFEAMVENFLQDVNIEGVGLEITDEDRVMIASSAIIPIFGFPEWKYTHLTNVILYPDTFNHEFEFEGQDGRNISGMVGSGYMNGQMILSRAALLKGFSKNSGSENTAIHEFVHLIDGEDGAIDGVPEIADHNYAGPWLQMMHKEMSKIKEGKSDIDSYAATTEAEFLAVTSEYFFEKPDKFKSEHPELYNQLSVLFKQDPASADLLRDIN